MDTRPEAISESLRAELVAYLANELEPEAARAMARRIAAEPALRREADRLSASWELLDLLPVVAGGTARLPVQEASASLAQTIEARVLGEASVPARKRWRTGLLAGLVFAVCVLGGHQAARRARPSAAIPEPALSLSLAENLEEYEAAGTWEFARYLADQLPPEPMAEDESEPAPSSPSPGA